MHPMSFQYCDLMFHEYCARGYVVFRGIVPPSLLRDLRVEADKARELAHAISGPQAQRLQPVSKYADRLNLKPFQDYTELPVLRDAITRLFGSSRTHGHINKMGILVEPTQQPWNVGWHRDGVVEVPTEAYDDQVKTCLAEAWHDLRYWNQINCAIYADSCTWYVPGSHLRQRDLPGEKQSVGAPELKERVQGLSSAEAERFFLEHCREFPGALQVHLGPGDFLLYRNLGWHTGNYLPYQPRATIHDVINNKDYEAWHTIWFETKKKALARMEARRTKQN